MSRQHLTPERELELELTLVRIKEKLALHAKLELIKAKLVCCSMYYHQ